MKEDMKSVLRGIAIMAALCVTFKVCSSALNGDKQQAAAAAPVIPTVSRLAAAETPAPVAPRVITSSAAIFADGELYACTDFALRDLPELDKLSARADAGLEFVFNDDLNTWLGAGKSVVGGLLRDTHDKDSSANLRPSGKPQILSKACVAQFSRTTIATCSTEMTSAMHDGGSQIHATLKTTYYQIPPDTSMNGCLAAGSDWWEAARDSSEYRYEKSQESSRRLLKMVGQQ